MRRQLSVWALVLVGMMAFGGATYAAFFALDCVTCGDGDSGTATGDGVAGVGTSDGTADFDGAPPSLESLGVHWVRDLRLTLNAPDPGPSSEACPSSIPNCDFNYTAVRVTRLTMFVSAFRPGSALPQQVSDYCLRSWSPCVPIDDIRAGESFSGDELEAVIFSAELVPSTGLVLNHDTPLTLRLNLRQWLTLQIVWLAAKLADPAAEHYIGFAVQASAVDPNPNDGNPVQIVPFSRILTVEPTVN